MAVNVSARLNAITTLLAIIGYSSFEFIDLVMYGRLIRHDLRLVGNSCHLHSLTGQRAQRSICDLRTTVLWPRIGSC